MKKTADIKKIACGGILAAGVLLPQVFHLLGGAQAGGMFLPMHFPVIIGGFFLGPVYGLLLGVLTPVLSFLLTGMPPAAKLAFMVLELATYGGACGLFHRKMNLHLSLVLAMLAGRAVYALSLFVAGNLLHLNVPAVGAVTAAVVTGLPGITLQLILIPALEPLLRRASGLFGAPAQ